MAKNSKTYSIDEVKGKMEDFLDISQEKLRARLRAAWKKQKSTVIKAYDQIKV